MMPDPYPVIWGNKGLAFITWLGAFLLKVRPESILDIGGGRTTTTLYDYAFRFQKPIMTIEHSALWVNKLREDLCFLKIEDPHYLDSIQHVPLSRSAESTSDSWYDLDTFDGLVAEHAYDMVCVDGPIGETRRNADGQARIVQAASAARMILVDDVHRPYNLELFWRITDERFCAADRCLYPYANRENVVAVACCPDWAVVARAIWAFMDLEYWPCCTRL